MSAVVVSSWVRVAGVRTPPSISNPRRESHPPRISLLPGLRSPRCSQGVPRSAASPGSLGPSTAGFGSGAACNGRRGGPGRHAAGWRGRGLSLLPPEAGAQGAAFSEIPVVDLAGLERSDEERLETLARLRWAAHQTGFMYVTGHGIPEGVLDGTLGAAREFFALPEGEKVGMGMIGSPAFRGYVVQGAENTAGVPDQREQVEFGVEAGAGCARGLPAYRRLVGPNQWPDAASAPSFRPALEDFLGRMEGLSRLIMGGLAEAMGRSPSYFDPTFGDSPNVQLKIARYPPPPPGRGGEGGGVGWYGVGAHSDSGYLSILLQDDVGGLQVLSGDGEWVDAPPVRGALVVNLGEMLQLVTGGFYLATVHRVVNRGDRDRVSVPYFWNPRLDAAIEPMPEDELAALPWQRGRPEASSSSATHGGRNRLLPVYGDNAFKSLARSHPRVLEQHHGDLILLSDGRYAPAEAAAGSVSLSDAS